MKTSTALVLCLLVFVAVCVYTAVVYPGLPDTVPTHWGPDGKPNAWGSRNTVFLWPGITLGMTVLMWVLPVISPKNFKIDSFRQTFNYIVFIVVAMMGYISFVGLLMTQNPHWDLSKALLGGILAFTGLLGNMLGKVKRNFFVGIRTPWTLANERVWDATHRLGARLMTFAGVAGAIAILVGAPAMPVFFVFIALTLYPVVYSLILYKRLERAQLL